ncbi:glycoside hydrolase family 2 sugar binding protein [Coriobacterium glomerans PW2]|uniref:Glycoside hydrolase family 2 sugar binding protein n=1 Tax=Coriobacterium glomerans (strain ATCC 49209 / DSM 20642 / JCM 10262 / PW2) TaxID=700015 RepID=F2NA31_CORGP|nr:glycoside hydrolase family 2 [Coriobacterium glomerans]AEB06425.1 glycoside hydrolase family 2 sugar binding protein [Coriobacterium glomerans PW2]
MMKGRRSGRFFPRKVGDMMLDIKRVLGSAKSHVREELSALATPWRESIDPDHVLSEHPRPQLMRDNYTMLNGLWDYAIVPLEQDGPLRKTAACESDEILAAMRQRSVPRDFDGQILVPFSPEAPLSGVGRTLAPDELLWYRRRIELPALEGDRRLLVHFGAVDWACAVFVDGALAGTHSGGYLPFDIDITPFANICVASEAELAVCAYDPTDAGTQLRGKQRLKPGGIWYTPQSGIWRSVWTEVVPAAYVSSLTLDGDAQGHLSIAAEIADPAGLVRGSAVLELAVSDPSRGAADGRPAEKIHVKRYASGRARATGRIRLEQPHLWSPDDPHLYRVEATLQLGANAGSLDTVSSYCAFRSVGVAPDDSGVARFFLNGSPLFLKGVLDQGYWSDGLMTAPADEALVHDIVEMKRAGFNMLRKHIKIESARWYWHCDRLGMLVWQDAVSGGGPYSLWHTSRKPTLLKASWGAFRDDTPRHRRALAADDEGYSREWIETCASMVHLLAGHPSIVTWVLFNEGWGQFDALEAAERVHRIDPSRPIDAVSGWYDQRCGDYLSHHNYFRPLTVDHRHGALRGYAAGRGCRAFIISEFGGLAQQTPDHMASPHAYGYGSFPTAAQWRDAVRRTLAEAAALEPKGLAGFVYTQLSDVEEELNGILTYDRRVNKLDDEL